MSRRSTHTKSLPATGGRGAGFRGTLTFKMIVCAPLAIAVLMVWQAGAGAGLSARSRRLVEAVRSNDLMLTATLLESGAHPDTRSAEGVTVLGLAVRNGALGMARLLLDHGADGDLPADDNVLPQELARERNQLEIERLLLAARERGRGRR